MANIRRAGRAGTQGVVGEIQLKVSRSGSADIQGDHVEFGVVGVSTWLVSGGVPGDSFYAGSKYDAAGSLAFDGAKRENGAVFDLALESHAENRERRIGG